MASEQTRKAETQERTAVHEKERAETALLQFEKERARADRAISAATDAARALGSDFAQGGGDLKGVPRDVVKVVLTRAHEIIKTLVSAGETSPERDLATSLERIADLQLAEGDVAGALAKFEEALAIREKLAAASANTQWRRDLALSLRKVADARRALANRAGALPLYEKSLSIYETLSAAEPLDAELQRSLAISLERMGTMRRDAGDVLGAMPVFERSLAIYATLAAADGADTRFQRGQAIALVRIAGIRGEQGDTAGALDYCGKSLAIYEKLAAAEPLDAKWQAGIVIAFNMIARLARDQGDGPVRAAYEKMLPVLEKGVALTEETETKNDGKPGKDTATQLNGVAWTAIFGRDFAKALSASERAHAINPDSLVIETNRAHALLFLDRGDEARAIYMTHRGKKLDPSDKLWEQVIAEDFAKFRTAGLDSSLMAEIEEALKTPASPTTATPSPSPTPAAATTAPDAP